MRQRLIDYARRNPDDVLTTDIDTPSRLPNRQTHPPTPKQEWDWVEEELRVLASAIFRSPTTGEPVPSDPSLATRDTASTHPSNACLKCHYAGALSVAGDRQSVPGFAIAPPGIPTRWLPHSRFRHDRHLKMECVDCHLGSRGNAAATAASSPGETLVGTTVKDILMPPLQTCQTCHGAAGGSPRKIRARNHCTECHQYHHVNHAKAADGRADN